MNAPDIRLLGLGGCGSRLAEAAARATGGHMSATVVDSDGRVSAVASAANPVVIGGVHFRLLGSGGDSAAAAMAVEEDRLPLVKAIDGAALLVVVAGLGGGTGSGALPAVLRLAASRSVPTLVFTVAPFRIEGVERLKSAAAAVRALEGLGTVRVRLSNDDLVADAPECATLPEAMARADSVAVAALSLIWSLCARPAYLRLDPATLLETLSRGRGDAHFAFARAEGADRAAVVAHRLLEGPGPALRVHADDIRGALVGVTGGTDLRLAEVGAAAGAVSGILPTGTPVRLSVALDAVREGALEVAVLAFRDWAESSATGDEGAGSTSIHAPDRFAGVAATPIGGENLDDPTWLRRNLRLAL